MSWTSSLSHLRIVFYLHFTLTVPLVSFILALSCSSNIEDMAKDCVLL